MDSAVMVDCREKIRRAKFLDEDSAVGQLLADAPYDDEVAGQIENLAAELVRAARSEQSRPLLDTFLCEYGLSNSEGVALMCLAESLLRVPDWQTADLLIADKLGQGSWDSHLGQADSLLVNASTWALMLTGRLVELDDELLQTPVPWIKKLIARLSEPVVQAAVRSAMEILGREFVLGETIEQALNRSEAERQYSFDMLGEAARDANSARRYYQRYLQAIEVVGSGRDDASVSIKLSALHPRYEAAQFHRVRDELIPIVAELCKRAEEYQVAIALDAEEADRLELSLEVFEELVRVHGCRNVGFVVQAYSKRAPYVLDWLVELARQHKTKFAVRLVKGAYWDAEIKHAQVEGLAGFPVYTRKENTDLAYLYCARKIFENPEELYGQFATHNAHTVAAILTLGKGCFYEFQRLHGMGEMLYRTAQNQCQHFPRVRTYAPVGCHEDLLAYLVRRLLENGANSSFVNRFLDQDVAPEQLVRDPLAQVQNAQCHHHDAIKLPQAIFSDRANSAGVDLADLSLVRSLQADLSERREVQRPVPAVTSNAEIDEVIASAIKAQRGWDSCTGRAEVLYKAADLIEVRRHELLSLLVDEAGKTISDGINEIREAADFCRYYASQIDVVMGDDTCLPGPTGERNVLKLHGRGVWVCISPWNFPLAIFLGQISAALAAGNSVIAKPAEETPRVAERCLELLLEAGVPEDVCQLAIGGGEVGEYLVKHADIAGVAFTGGTETARRINISMAHAERPIVPLIAETGGQNAMIVDSTALLEQVTDDVIDSAFRSAGQRCSAVRVLFLQADIADSAIELIKGAMDELRVGDPSLHATDVGPVISAKAAARLQQHIADMRAHGYVLHQSTRAGDWDNIVLPTLIEIPNIDVLKEEHFGPILHIVRFDADQVDAVIEGINSTGFGLTFGIHTRIESRARYVADKVAAGNVYVNRNITGAVVGSQPFGGLGYSGTGPKAGGPNYLQRFTVEKVVTTNTVATGGNAELLNL